jgi:pimeloyl-ACP methyl ester carboxylesterase
MNLPPARVLSDTECERVLRAANSPGYLRPICEASWRKRHLVNSFVGSITWTIVVSVFGILLCLSLSALCPADYTTTTQTFALSDGSGMASYLLMTSTGGTTSGKHPLIVYLYGRGGAIQPGQYNLATSAYNKFRQVASNRGYDIIVPELGTDDWMNDQAQHTLDAIIADAGTKNLVNLNVVQVMGVSMGGGSALAYAIHRPDLVKSVSAWPHWTPLSNSRSTLRRTGPIRRTNTARVILPAR